LKTWKEFLCPYAIPWWINYKHLGKCCVPDTFTFRLPESLRTAGPEARYIHCRGRQAPVCMPKKSASPEGATQGAQELGDWQDSITLQMFKRGANVSALRV